MERILFCMRYYSDNSKDNLSCKFKGQISAAMNLGYDVWFMEIDENSIYLVHNDMRKKIQSIYKGRIPVISKILFYMHFCKAINKIIDKEVSFNYVYIRNIFFLPSYINALNNMRKKNTKVIIEIPTYPILKEIRAMKFGLKKIVIRGSLMMEEVISQFVDYYVLIGEKAESYLGKPTVNIGNGIDVDAFKLREPKLNLREVRLIAVASVANWHGYDRIIEGINKYKRNNGKERIILHIVGSDGDGSLAKLKYLARKYDLENEVIFEGALYGEALNGIFDTCDIGIAALGAYRKGFNVTSELKIREYMSRGIPFIYSGIDSALNDTNKYHIIVPNDESPIDIQEIVKFALEIRIDTDIPLRMREYASQNMTWEIQFEKIFSKL